MTTVLVTGATGLLGRYLVEELREADVEVRSLSHRPAQGRVYGDLLSGQGLSAALAGAQTIIHAATAIRGADDISMTRQLLQALRGQHIDHLIYISIVGLEKMTAFDYYAAKLESERLIKLSGLPYTIVRATQFFELVEYGLRRLQVGGVQMASADVRIQPVEARAVACRLADLALRGRVFDPPELAGPQILDLTRLAQLKRQGRPRRLINMPVPMRSLREGALLPGRPERIGITWEEWLSTHRDRPSPYAEKYRWRLVR